MKTKVSLTLLVFVSSMAGLQAKLPEHARLIPADMMGMVTLHPGQILSKMDHLSLITRHAQNDVGFGVGEKCRTQRQNAKG